METNFFQAIAALNVKGGWTLNITNDTTGKWIVSVLFYNEKVGDDDEYMEDWYNEVRETEDSDYADSYLSELSTYKYYGDVMQRKLHSPYHLEYFHQRIGRYRPVTEFEHAAPKAAKQSYGLLQDYPEANIFRHTDFTDPDLYDDEVV